MDMNLAIREVSQKIKRIAQNKVEWLVNKWIKYKDGIAFQEYDCWVRFRF